MPIQIAPRWLDSKVPIGIAERAAATLEEVLGRHGHMVDATWDVVDPASSDSDIKVILRDDESELSARFKQAEVGPTTEFRLRLRIIWGNFLQQRANRQFETLFAVGD